MLLRILELLFVLIAFIAMGCRGDVHTGPGDRQAQAPAATAAVSAGPTARPAEATATAPAAPTQRPANTPAPAFVPEENEGEMAPI